MLEDKKRSSVQKVFGIVGYNDNQINQRIEAVHREFPRTVYVSKMNKDSVTFIGPTRDICNDAWSTFQSAKFDEPTMNSYCATKNQDNYCELNCYKFCDNKLIMRVLQGDIVDQSTTAIVNAANEHLHGGGGVTGAIYHAGGQEFQRHCVEVMRKRDYQPMGIGEVLATEACGRLICKRYNMH